MTVMLASTCKDHIKDDKQKDLNLNKQSRMIGILTFLEQLGIFISQSTSQIQASSSN